MTYYLVPRMTRREMQRALDALKAPLRFPRAEGGFVPPTEPRDQEHDMNDRDRRAEAEFYFDEAESVESHKESVALSSAGALSALLAIHDLLDERLPRRGIDLTPRGFTDFLAAAKGEPVDVTEEPPCGSQVTDRDGDVWQRFERGWVVVAYEGSVSVDVDDEVGRTWDSTRTRFGPLRLTTDADRERVGLLVDTARGVDPDEALNRAVAEAIDDVSPPPPAPWDADWLDRATAAAIRAVREHTEAEQGNPDTWNQVIDHANRRAEKAEAEVERLTRERDDLRYRVDDLIRERGQSIERYRALRQDAVGEYLHARDGSKAEASLAYVLDRAAEVVTPDDSDPGWASVVHDTHTIACMGGVHLECPLPTHCQCGCHYDRIEREGGAS